MRILRPLSAALLLGCASTPARTAPPPEAPAAPLAPPVATLEPDAGAPVVPPPAVDPCAQGALHDLLAALPPGNVLADARVGGRPRPRERRMDLDPLFPALRSEGFTVLAVSKADVLPGGALIALVAPVDATIARDREVSHPELALLTCRANVGWSLAARPHSLGSESLPQLLSVEPTSLPGGGPGATVTVLTTIATAESNATPYLMGAATAALRVTSPRGATAGVLGVLGTVGERVVAEGISEYRSLAPMDAAGWYPLGADRVFVRVARELVPQENGRWAHALSATPLSTLDEQGVHDAQNTAVWMLFGAGPMPAWCTGRADLRCAALTQNGAAVPGVTIPYTWVAGAWSVGSAVPRDLRAPGARWFHAGSWDGERPPRGPDGRAPLTTIPVTDAPLPPTPRARR